MERPVAAVLLAPLALFLLGTRPACGLENGLARTPPMGWLAWERFLCNVDCARDPENCISERLFKEMADKLVSEGYRDAGYEYVNIDDCWMSTERDAAGRLQADPARFPRGIKHIADYVVPVMYLSGNGMSPRRMRSSTQTRSVEGGPTVTNHLCVGVLACVMGRNKMHARGLKLGIYGDVGTKTCAGYPGSFAYLYTDAQTFADWEVDMVKMDGCYASLQDFQRLYTEFNTAINRTGRPMVYSCSWPAYEVQYSMNPNYKLIGQHCNLWRNYMDIADTWQSVENVIDYYAANQNALTAAAAPGRWNDPDMLVIGNFGLSYDQSKAQMALWAIMASPLLMSNDLRRMRPEFKQILQNKAVIAVNQDPLGIMGRKILTQYGVETWSRAVSPVVGDSGYSFALVFFNRNTMGGPREHAAQLKSLGLVHPQGYRVIDLFENRFLGIYRPEDYLSVRVNPSGVVMVKAEALPPVAPSPVGRLQPTQFGPPVRTGVTGRSEQLPVPTFVLRRTDVGGVPFEVVVVGQTPIRGLRGRIVRRVPARKRVRQDD